VQPIPMTSSSSSSCNKNTVNTLAAGFSAGFVLKL
jgi:hypothetical protein